jgi:hypothetical protein
MAYKGTGHPKGWSDLVCLLPVFYGWKASKNGPSTVTQIKIQLQNATTDRSVGALAKNNPPQNHICFFLHFAFTQSKTCPQTAPSPRKETGPTDAHKTHPWAFDLRIRAQKT